MARAPREERKGPPPDEVYWRPPGYDVADIVACQALEKGEANKDQQLRFVRWFHKACRTYGMTYSPKSDRDSAFAEGRRHIGRWFVNLCQFNPAAFRKKGDHVSEKE
jgi:hypothetical protein